MGAPVAANPYMVDPFAQQQSFGGAPNANFPNQPPVQQPAFNAVPPFQANHQSFPNQQQQQTYPEYADFNTAPTVNIPKQPQQQPQLFNPMAPGQAIPGFGMFQQPIVQSMAMEYGQQLADQGKQIMESQFEKYIPVTRLKYYFAVDNKYVINKLRLLFFPFTQTVRMNNVFFN